VDTRTRQVAARRPSRPADHIDPGLVSVRAADWPAPRTTRRVRSCRSNSPTLNSSIWFSAAAPKKTGLKAITEKEGERDRVYRNQQAA
jgi:hypothetical protein